MSVSLLRGRLIPKNCAIAEESLALARTITSAGRDARGEEGDFLVKCAWDSNVSTFLLVLFMAAFHFIFYIQKISYTTVFTSKTV